MATDGKIFISYARPTLARAKAVARALVADGHEVWIDDQLLANRAFGDTIEHEIGAARAVLVLWSADAIRSDWVRAEANRARETGKLVQVRLDATPLPLPFDQIHCIDLTNWKGDRSAAAWRAVLDSVATVGGDRPAAITAPAAPRRGRALVAAGVAAAVLVAVGAGTYLLRQGADGPAVTAAPPNSIAVLPFDNLSGDPSQAYFADGMAEELRDALAGVGGLQVAARTSSNAFRGSTVAIGAIAGKLGVAYVLDGSVRRAGSHVRISTQFIDARSGFEQWSHTYDRQVDDVLTVQSEVAHSVTDALKVKLQPRDAKRLAQGGTRVAAALDAYLRGRQLFDQSGDEATYRRALAEFDAAIAADPNFAAAHAARAAARSVMGSQFATTITEANRAQADALESARRGVALGPDLPVTQAALAYVLQQARIAMPDAGAAYARALAAGGDGDANILIQYGGYQVIAGDPPKGIAALEKAVTLDRFNPRAWSALGHMLFLTRRYDDSLAKFTRARELNPKIAFVHNEVGFIKLMQGDLAGARREFQAEPQQWARCTGLAMVERKLGNAAAAEAAFKLLVDGDGDTVIYQQAEVLAQWGRRDAAIAALTHAADVRDPGLGYMRQDPLLDPIRDDPRFKALLAQWWRR